MFAIAKMGSFFWLFELLSVLSVLGEICSSDLFSGQNIHRVHTENPVSTLLVSVWLPPASQHSALLSIAAENQFLRFIQQTTSASSLCGLQICGEVSKMAILQDVLVTKWKVFGLFLASNSLYSELSVCLAYTKDLRTCVSVSLKEQVFNYTSFDIQLSIDIPPNSLEIRTNGGNLQEHLTVNVSSLRKFHSLSPFRYEVITRKLSSSDITIQFIWEIIDFNIYNIPKYIAISGCFSFTHEVLNFHLLSREQYITVCYMKENQPLKRFSSSKTNGNRRITATTFRTIGKDNTRYRFQMHKLTISRQKLDQMPFYECSLALSVPSSSPAQVFPSGLQVVLTFTCPASSHIGKGYSEKLRDIHFRAETLQATNKFERKQITSKLKLRSLSKSLNSSIQSFALIPFPLSKFPRYLETTHYASFTYEGYISHDENQYFTFYNTHTATQSIFISLIRSSGDPDLKVAKNYSGSFDYSVHTQGSDYLTIYPNDAEIFSKGGIIGSFTVAVYGYNAGDYKLTVKITCTQTSGNCYCPVGKYPDPSTSSCSTCPGSNATCQNFQTQSCLPMSRSTSYSPGSFDCCQCLGGVCGSSSVGTCYCYSSCATCKGMGENECLTCKQNSSISSSAPSTCACDQGYFPDTTNNRCSSCNSECYQCSSSSAAGCIACYSKATLASTAPSRCICDSKYFPNTNASQCSDCNQLCVNCSNGTDTGCTSCPQFAQLNGASPNSCICLPGYIPISNVLNCQQCDSTCLECVGVSEIDCKSCKSTDASIEGTAHGKCICNDGTFPNPKSDNCSSCDITCKTCTNGTDLDCKTCKPNATKSGNTGKCTCNSGFFPNPNSGSCSACHKSCKECRSEAADKCIDCKDFAILEGIAPCACVCSAEAFTLSDASNCIGCSLTCRTCVGDGPLQCTTCQANALLKEPSPNQCFCMENFYPNPDPSLCLPCNPTCAKCANGVDCLSCKQFAELKQGMCVCISSYFGDPDASNCQPCPEGCLACLATGCSQCKPLYYTFEGQCLQECLARYKGTPDYHCVEINLTPAGLSLTVLDDNTLSVFFDKSMNCTVLSTDINVVIDIPEDKEISFTWKDPMFSGPQNLIIGLVFESQYLPIDSQANLQFISPENIIDEFGVAIITTSLTGTLKPFGTSPANITAVLLASPTAQQAAVASQGGVSASAISSLISGNPACLMSLVNQIQLISYMSMTKLPIPTEFASSLAALNVGNMLPNPLSRFNVLDEYEEAQTPSSYVSDYGIKTTLFIHNAMSFLGAAGAILLSFLPIYLLSKVKIPFIADYFKRKLPALKWSVPLQLWLTSYLDIGVFSLLQVVNADDSFSDPVSVVSFVISCFFLLAFALTPIAILVFLNRNYNLVHSRTDEDFNQRWGALFMQFKGDFNISSIAYFFIFSVRRCLFAICLVVTPNYLGLLALSNTSFSLLVTLT